MTERLKCCEAVGAAGKGESQLSRVLLFWRNLPRICLCIYIYIYITRCGNRTLRTAFREWIYSSWRANCALRHWALGNQSGQTSATRMYISQDGMGFWGNTKDPTVVSTYSKPFELMDDIQRRWRLCILHMQLVILNDSCSWSCRSKWNIHMYIGLDGHEYLFYSLRSNPTVSD
jgi:hypothetical protein